MKKILSYGFFIAVLLLSIVLAAGIAVAGPSEAGANERLASAPSLMDKDGNFNGDILSDTAAWVNDHFFARQELISLSNWLSARVFGVSDADDVVLGSDGWLYYGSTVDDYTGTSPLSDREIYSIARNVALMQEACEAEGKTFGFAIAPNKNSLYGEHMPDYGTAASVRDAQRVEAQLGQMGVNYIDLFSAIGGEEETLYFAHDSHWNSKGAALGADTINAALGRESDYYSGDFSQSQPHDGDLYEMLYPAFTDPETDPVYGGDLEYEFTTNATKADSITLLTESGGEGSLLCYRDSFGILLYPYLADSFASCRFSRSNTYDLTLDADFVVVELVERNLSYLIANQPVFLAPRRELEIPEASGTIVLEISTPKSPENTVLVKGTVPEDVDEDSPVYLVCGDVAYEAALLAENGFGAYLGGDKDVTAIAYYAGGELRLLTNQE